MSGSSSPTSRSPRAHSDEATRAAFRFSDLSGYSFKKRLTIRAASGLLTGLIRLLGSTIRYEFEGREHLDAASRDGRLPIYAFWHDSIALATYAFRGQNIVVMTSQSFDGEYIARSIQRFGYGTARGSSTRGGIGALIEMIRLMRNGYPAAFTIDGPKGPRHVAKPGAILLAKKTGHPIVPIAFVPSRSWSLVRSWDRTIAPKPFSRARVIIAPPVTVDPNVDEAGMEAKLRELQASLDALERRCQEWRTAHNSRSWWPAWIRRGVRAPG